MLDCLAPWHLIWNLFNPHQCAEIYDLTTLTAPFSITEYLPYLLKTLILELPIYLLFLKGQKSLNKILEINFVLNLATHPIVFFIIPLVLSLVNAAYLNYLVIAEIFAPLVEFFILYYFYKVSMRRAFLAAVLANLFSWSVGVFWV